MKTNYIYLVDIEAIDGDTNAIACFTDLAMLENYLRTGIQKKTFSMPDPKNPLDYILIEIWKPNSTNCKIVKSTYAVDGDPVVSLINKIRNYTE